MFTDVIAGKSCMCLAHHEPESMIIIIMIIITMTIIIYYTGGERRSAESDVCSAAGWQPFLC